MRPTHRTSINLLEYGYEMFLRGRKAGLHVYVHCIAEKEERRREMERGGRQGGREGGREGGRRGVGWREKLPILVLDVIEVDGFHIPG